LNIGNLITLGGSGFRGAAARRSTHIGLRPGWAQPNVADWQPLGDIILGAVITATRRPGGLHDTS